MKTVEQLRQAAARAKGGQQSARTKQQTPFDVRAATERLRVLLDEMYADD